MLLLFFVKLDRECNNTGYAWGKKDSIFLKRCKQNIISCHSTHYGSTGKYYSFGNRANFGLINNSSITQYVPKKYKNLDRMDISKENAAIMDDMSSDELIMGIKGLQSILPTIHKFIAPIINVTNGIQDNIGDLNIKK